MKKAFYGLLVFAMCSLTTVPAVLANPTSKTPEVVFEKEEIKDQKSLFERASKGITDLENSPFSPVGELENTKTKLKEKVKTISTTQHVKSEKYPNGEVKDAYVTTSFAIIPKHKSQTQNYTGSAGLEYDQSQSSGQWDESISVYAYSTIYWNKYNTDYFDLQKVDGGWSIQDSQMGVKDKRVRLAASGYKDYPAGYAEQYKDYYPSGLTYSYFAPSEWVPINSKATPRVFGMIAYCTIFDYTTSWNFTFKNQY
ncbi:hypothetical protein [Effusibacillus consociatus]|uniref:Uncharacterized protein n=1 Tax=Effusibacillus consociatus TaxID=1117041 RepID=A0ABV9Q7E8_9BACL